MHSVESERHYLSRKLQSARDSGEESKAASSKLELRLHESEQTLKELRGGKRGLEASLQTAEEQNGELNKKVSAVASVDCSLLFTDSHSNM